MTLRTWVDPYGIRVWRLEIPEIELGDTILEMDKIDKALLKECEESNSIADKLLALQTICFRYEQKHSKPLTNGLERSGV